MNWFTIQLGLVGWLVHVFGRLMAVTSLLYLLRTALTRDKRVFPYRVPGVGPGTIRKGHRYLWNCGGNSSHTLIKHFSSPVVSVLASGTKRAALSGGSLFPSGLSGAYLSSRHTLTGSQVAAVSFLIRTRSSRRTIISMLITVSMLCANTVNSSSSPCERSWH
jgi:hypothetical protein